MRSCKGTESMFNPHQDSSRLYTVPFLFIWMYYLKSHSFTHQLYVCAERQRAWLLQQVEIDTHFLQRLNVLDYSLLLAHQPLHHDERHQSLSFASLIMRAKKSVSLSCCPQFVALFRWFIISTGLLSVFQMLVVKRLHTQWVDKWRSYWWLSWWSIIHIINLLSYKTEAPFW